MCHLEGIQLRQVPSIQELYSEFDRSFGSAYQTWCDWQSSHHCKCRQKTANYTEDRFPNLKFGWQTEVSAPINKCMV